MKGVSVNNAPRIGLRNTIGQPDKKHCMAEREGEKPPMIDIKEKAMKRAKRFFSFNHSLSGPADVGYFNAEQRRELE